MPRYFFQIDDNLASRDDEGTEFPDIRVAKCEAVKLAGQMICDSAGDFWDRQEWKLTATNEAGLTLFCLHFVGIEAPATMGPRDPTLIAARLVAVPEEPAGEAPSAMDAGSSGAAD